MASFGFQMNLFVVMLVLMCNVLQIRVVLTNEEALQNDFVSIPLHYGMDEEVENIKNEGSGEEDENDGITKHEQIQIIQKSPDKMTKVGDAVTLTCKSNVPWVLCGWQQPNFEWCDRLSTSFYDTHCHYNPRIQYSKSSLANGSGNECSITIMDAQGQDTGLWTCHVKQDIRSTLFSEAFINLDVAAPYRLSVDVPRNVKFGQPKNLMTAPTGLNISGMNKEELFNSDNDGQHASCSASSLDRHGGGIDPQLTWFVNGMQLKNMSSEMLEKSKQVSSDGKRITSNLRLSRVTMFETDSPFNIIPVVKSDQCVEYDAYSNACKRFNGTLEYSFRLRCLSRQIFPNGTVISESSLAKDLTVERFVDNITEDMKPIKEPSTGKTNVGASVITGLIVILILVAIGLVCYAQRFKKWCYADRPRRIVSDNYAEPEVEIRYDNEDEDNRRGNQVVVENHETLPTTPYNAGAMSHMNNDRFSATQNGALPTTETSRLIASGQDENLNHIEPSVLHTLEYTSTSADQMNSVDQSVSDLRAPSPLSTVLNVNAPVETPTIYTQSGNARHNGTTLSPTHLSSGMGESSFTNGDFDAIESIDTEPEVITNSVEFVPESITGTKVEMRKNLSGTIPDEKYLSLIESSPHTVELQLSPLVVPNGTEENGERLSKSNSKNTPKFFSETRKSLTDLIAPSPEFSESLSVPRKPNLRKENQYVKFQPSIEKFQPSHSNTSIGSVRETPL